MSIKTLALYLYHILFMFYTRNVMAPFLLLFFFQKHKLLSMGIVCIDLALCTCFVIANSEAISLQLLYGNDIGCRINIDNTLYTWKF